MRERGDATTHGSVSHPVVCKSPSALVKLRQNKSYTSSPTGFDGFDDIEQNRKRGKTGLVTIWYITHLHGSDHFDCGFLSNVAQSHVWCRRIIVKHCTAYTYPNGLAVLNRSLVRSQGPEFRAALPPVLRPQRNKGSATDEFFRVVLRGRGFESV